MIRGRCVAIVLSVLPLAGCFVSDEALIDGNRAAYPLPQTAAVESYSWDTDNKIWKHAHYRTLARAGIGYRLVDDTGEAINFVLMEVNSSTWLVEEGKPDDDSTFNYALITRNDKGQYVVRNLDLRATVSLPIRPWRRVTASASATPTAP